MADLSWSLAMPSLRCTIGCAWLVLGRIVRRPDALVYCQSSLKAIATQLLPAWNILLEYAAHGSRKRHDAILTTIPRQVSQPDALRANPPLAFAFEALTKFAVWSGSRSMNCCSSPSCNFTTPISRCPSGSTARCAPSSSRRTCKRSITPSLWRSKTRTSVRSSPAGIASPARCTFRRTCAAFSSA